MRLTVIVFLLTVAGCGIYQEIPSHTDEDAGDDASMDGDMGRDLSVKDVALPEDAEHMDLTIQADIPDMLSDAGDVGGSGCSPTCAAGDVCVDQTCLTLNGGSCGGDDDCVSVCDRGTCAPRKSIWVWDHTVILDPISRGMLANFVSAKNVRRLFLESEAFMYGVDDPAMLAMFIQSAQQEGIEVFLLFGFAEWALPANHLEISQLISLADTFAATVRPDGIVLDVEPHALPEWANTPEELGGNLVTMYEEVMLANTTNLPVFATVPFWYDTIMVTRGNDTKPLHEWLLETTDGLAVMNYRDMEAGANGLTTHASIELEDAERLKKRVIVNVETQCGLLDTTTFCEEGEQAMETELSAFRAATLGIAALDGIGIHDYASYSMMLP